MELEMKRTTLDKRFDENIKCISVGKEVPHATNVDLEHFITKTCYMLNNRYKKSHPEWSKEKREGQIYDEFKRIVDIAKGKI